MIPFALAFEGRRPQARELVLLAALTALIVASRAVLFMVPQGKPVAALVIICGAALGPRSGFLLGALSIFVSNFFFGQGPWTPWQMAGMGLIGLLAGVLFSGAEKKAGARYTAALCVYGFFATLVLYGLLLDTASALLFSSTFSWKIWLTVCLAGLPFNLLHAGMSILFLAVLSAPVTEKITRIKRKYGLLTMPARGSAHG
jgi:energy-coupling factor transport system substrate-specific component